MGYSLHKMNDKTDGLEFDVLGFCVKFRPSGDTKQVSPQKAVELVLKEANDIRSTGPRLDNGQLATLVALRLASENLELQKEYQKNIDQLQKSAIQALHSLEEASS